MLAFPQVNLIISFASLFLLCCIQRRRGAAQVLPDGDFFVKDVYVGGRSVGTLRKQVR